MTIPEASKLILQAAAMGGGNLHPRYGDTDQDCRHGPGSDTTFGV
jgi:hypothetical protein